MVDHLWKVNKEETKDHWLELIDPEGWWRAAVKWDGCIHFYRYGNIPLDVSPDRKDKGCSDDYIHICDLDDFIARLQALKQIALVHFGKDWQ